jgi:prepilin-type N-terminal cleavage/methylation domain-containing protein
MRNRKQGGFTLIELLVVIAILVLVSSAVVMTLSVVTQTSTTALGQGMALSEVHMAGNWISRDVVSAVADSVQPTSGSTLCSMQAYAWNNSSQSFDYPVLTYVLTDGVLTRQVGSAPATQVAKFIDPAATIFTCEDNATRYFKLTVRAEYNGTGVTEVYRIKQVLTQ